MENDQPSFDLLHGDRVAVLLGDVTVTSALAASHVQPCYLHVWHFDAEAAAQSKACKEAKYFWVHLFSHCRPLEQWAICITTASTLGLSWVIKLKQLVKSHIKLSFWLYTFHSLCSASTLFVLITHLARFLQLHKPAETYQELILHFITSISSLFTLFTVGYIYWKTVQNNNLLSELKSLLVFKYQRYCTLCNCRSANICSAPCIMQLQKWNLKSQQNTNTKPNFKEIKPSCCKT